MMSSHHSCRLFPTENIAGHNIIKTMSDDDNDSSYDDDSFLAGQQVIPLPPLPELPVPVHTEADAVGQASLPPVPLLRLEKSAFECEKLVKGVTTASGRKGWTCGWCKCTFTPEHATRALKHVLKLKKNDITVCSATVTEPHLGRYKELNERLTEQTNDRKRTHDESVDMILEQQGAAAQQLLNKRGKGGTISSATSISSVSSISRSSSLSAGLQPSISASIENTADINRANKARLGMAIADLFHCGNIPDSLADSKRL